MSVNVAVVSSLMFFIKLTALLLYLRLFGTKRYFKYAVWLVGAFTFAYSFSGIAISIWRCSPRAKAWDLTIQGGECRDHNWRLVLFGAFGVVSDFAVLLLPMPVLWTLHLPKAKKLGLMAIFATGILYDHPPFPDLARTTVADGPSFSVCAVGIVRLKVFTDVFTTLDFTWTLVSSGNWEYVGASPHQPYVLTSTLTYPFSVVEANVGIACVCMPCLKPMIQKHMPNLFNITAFSVRGSKKRTGSSSVAKGSSSDRSWPTKVVAEGPYIELGEKRGKHEVTIDSRRDVDVAAAAGADGSDPSLDRAPLDGRIVKTVGIDVIESPRRVGVAV